MPETRIQTGRRESKGTAALMAFTAICILQLGSATATSIFDEVGPAGTVFYRLVFAAVILAVIWRPWRLLREGRRPLLLAAAYGVSLAVMNLCFYESLDRIDLGVAVTLEFVGPLAVAVVGSRRRRDLLWVALAAAGVVLLADPAGETDLLGVSLALVAGASWGAYILISARVGSEFSGGNGLALAMPVAAVLVAGPGIAGAGADLLNAEAAAVGLGVAVLSSVIPYSLELEALRRLPVAVFGVLMSVEPGVAALIGFVALGQALSAHELAGIVLVASASIGSVSGSGAEPDPDGKMVL